MAIGWCVRALKTALYKNNAYARPFDRPFFFFSFTIVIILSYTARDLHGQARESGILNNCRAQSGCEKKRGINNFCHPPRGFHVPVRCDVQEAEHKSREVRLYQGETISIGQPSRAVRFFHLGGPAYMLCP